MLANHELSDQAVVERVRQGDVALFEVIMRRYNQRLYRVARALLGDADEAEDLVQDAYVRAYEHLAQFQGRARFSTWLTRIAVHEARARLRKRRRMAGPEETIMAVPDPSSDARLPEHRACAAELRRALAGALDGLPRQLRAVFVLREVDGLGTQETAECLGLTPANVKVRLHRARAQLRTALERALGAEAPSLYSFDGERCDRIVQRVFGLLAARPSHSKLTMGNERLGP